MKCAVCAYEALCDDNNVVVQCELCCAMCNYVRMMLSFQVSFAKRKREEKTRFAVFTFWSCGWISAKREWNPDFKMSQFYDELKKNFLYFWKICSSSQKRRASSAPADRWRWERENELVVPMRGMKSPPPLIYNIISRNAHNSIRLGFFHPH